MSINNTTRAIAGAALAATISVLGTSCGGGSSAQLPGPTPGGPASGFADLKGQLTQGSGIKPVSSVGSGLGGVNCSLVNAATGAVAGSDTTDSSGKFEIKNVPSGSGFEVQVEFTSTSDLNGDGSPDQVKMKFPVTLADQAVVSFDQSIGLTDSNSDGSPDSVDVSTDINDDHGDHESDHQEIRHRDGVTVEDSNGNGSFSDDTGFDDSNCDGMPDSSGSGSDDSAGDDNGSGGNGADDSAGGTDDSAGGTDGSGGGADDSGSGGSDSGNSGGSDSGNSGGSGSGSGGGGADDPGGHV